MTVFKCKMCGASLEITGKETVAVCEYCGSKQTLPRLNDDRKANLFDRANHFRRNNEFDKAMALYEQILNEDINDAEIYWSLVLCRYGIEYVEDPSTHRRIPTVNRTQFTSIFADENYKSAIANADIMQKEVYEKEAKEIDEIQKGILEISQKEEPCNVFICYKETDSNGRRTQDSVLANDLYHQLTQEGFYVFFSRITLEDKLGSAYEPYIFAALNSAQVMIVLGTKPEHFNAVWVKNEWSRFLTLLKNGEKKVLIPAYRDMDPYDLPEEFSHLQAQDMSKLGFMQDLIRGIKKIIGSDENTALKEAVTVNSGNANVTSLLKRAFIFLDDGEWKRANEYCEKVLDINPECADAYIGLLMVELQISEEQELVNKNGFSQKKNFEKALRYASEQRQAVLMGYVEKQRILEEKRRKAEAEEKRRKAEAEEERRKAEAEEERRKAEEEEQRRTAKILELQKKRNELEKANGIIYTSDYTTIGLKTDGTVVAVGNNYYGQRNVSTWRDIVAVSCGDRHTVGLKTDGTVVAVVSNSSGQCNVTTWRDIVAVSCGNNHTVGLKKDGTVVAVGINYSGQCNVTTWRDIVAVSCGNYYTVGLKKDGTVVATGDNDGDQCNVTTWRDIVAVSCGAWQTVGLKTDGTVVAVGNNYSGQCNVTTWRDIVAVSCGDRHTVGLKTDGTVVAVGRNDEGQCNLSTWRDIVAVSCDYNHTVGLKKDGTVVATGANRSGQCKVSDWKLFDNLETIEEQRWRAQSKCQHCGGELRGLFGKKCAVCGKPKDY